ncbi:MAG: spheroidene monooxygenase, partial [Acidimicrobiales bacterium]
DSTAGGADLARWAVFGVWEDEAALDAFESTHPLPARWSERAAERWSLRLASRRCRGRWAGIRPFRGSDHVSPDGGPVAVLTRATVRPSRLRAFHGAREPVDAVLHRAPGLLADVGMGEWPIGHQATFSLWRDEAAVRAFAMDDPAHTDVVRRTRDERWYAEELFAAFTVVAHRGTWSGADPLTPAGPAGDRPGTDGAGSGGGRP